MKFAYSKILPVFMALVVLLSTMSFTIDMHYCGGKLVDTAVFKKVKTCGMELQKPTSSPECSILKKDCCNDKQIVFEGQDVIKTSYDKFSFDLQFFVVSYLYSYINSFENLKEERNLFNDYPSPLIVRNIYKLDEVYLI